MEKTEYAKKAKEIYYSMKGWRITNKHRKKCSRVLCDTIIQELGTIIKVGGNTMILDFALTYWKEIRKEIEKL